MQRALITGVTGQDGALLAELLLNEGCTVHGLIRRSSCPNTERIDHLTREDSQFAGRFHLHHGDMTDGDSLFRVLRDTQPDEVYNLAAQSHVHVSFATAESKGLLIYVVGGPGGSGLSVADDYLSAYDSKLTENMDIVFFDQRGIGPGHGLACPKARPAPHSRRSRWPRTRRSSSRPTSRPAP